MSVRFEATEDSQFSHGIHDVSKSPPDRVGEAYDEGTARLFAAAPDMLAALEAVAEQEPSADFADGTVALVLLDTQWKAILSALAAAKGKG